MGAGCSCYWHAKCELTIPRSSQMATRVGAGHTWFYDVRCPQPPVTAISITCIDGMCVSAPAYVCILPSLHAAMHLHGRAMHAICQFYRGESLPTHAGCVFVCLFLPHEAAC
eukprot:1137696-Pelagomonas_calceolata.AAC.3